MMQKVAIALASDWRNGRSWYIGSSLWLCSLPMVVMLWPVNHPSTDARAAYVIIALLILPGVLYYIRMQNRFMRMAQGIVVHFEEESYRPLLQAFAYITFVVFTGVPLIGNAAVNSALLDNQSGRNAVELQMIPADLMTQILPIVAFSYGFAFLTEKIGVEIMLYEDELKRKKAMEQYWKNTGLDSGFKGNI